MKIYESNFYLRILQTNQVPKDKVEEREPDVLEDGQVV